jgi:hypothetical protein
VRAFTISLVCAGLVCTGAGGAWAEAPPPGAVAARNAALEAVAKAVRRGFYPRAFRGEQSYWTLLGVDGGAASGLISEDGAIELGKGGPSIEPFVIEHGRLVTWADVAETQSLQAGFLPIPSVTWRRRGWRLKVTSFATGPAASVRLMARYDLRNLTSRPLRLTLALAVRPLQVNGPEQFLNTPGGFSPINDLAFDGARLTANGRPAVWPLTAPDRFAAAGFDAAPTPDALLLAGARGSHAHDAGGLASGALIYNLTIPAHGRAYVDWVAPLGQGGQDSTPTRFRFEPQLAGVADAWRRRLTQVELVTPPQEQAVADTLKTSLAYMLMSRNGPMLRPGTRSYDRSWIRDGAMISEALLRLGETGVAADYLRWYAPFQFADGKIPCCVDARGHDPTPENDSEGEFVFLAAEVYRYGGDQALLRSVWSHVLAAVDYMDGLRGAQPPAAIAAGAPQATLGLLPPSISHEGYSSKPAYSYWDDFWGLRGYDDAVFIAQTLGERAAAERLAGARDAFRNDLYASLHASSRAHGIDYIPGAADLGDFDPTSTTIALAPGNDAEWLPKDLLDNTFERNWRHFVDRRDTDRTWDAYTPYELRAIGAYLRLGQRDRAAALLDFYMRGRRPPVWNGWAEVVGREPRKPRFIGDMPHAWVASDFVGSVLDMFAYSRESDRSLVLGAGLPSGWFESAEVGVRNLRTPYGRLTWSARMRSGKLIMSVGGDARPPGGFVFSWPFAGQPGAARLNGRALTWNAGVLRLGGHGQLVIEGAPARR